MDKECIKICNALNRLPSVRTIESCCGHGEMDFRVWFTASDMRAINCLGRLTSHNYSPFTRWKIVLDHCDILDYENQTFFCLVGTKENKNVFEEADEMADFLIDRLWNNFCKYTLEVEPFFDDKTVAYDY